MIAILNARRRLAVGALATVGLVTASVGSASASPRRQTAPAGAGTGIAELVQVDPAIANLALTIRVGTSLAGHQNLGATSEARTLDLGFIGSMLTGEGCDGGDPTIPADAIPEIVSASSADPAHAEGVSSEFAGLVSAYAQADTLPSSRATSTIEPLDLPGLVDVTGGRTEVTSSAEGHRTVAVSEISRVDIADGLVSIRGMRWEAIRQLEPAVSTASFSVGKLFVAGSEVPLPAGDALPTIQQALDPVLGPLGILLSFPEQVEIPNGVALTPLGVGVVPGELRDGILGPIFEAIQPARSDLTDFFLSLDCGNSTYVTVLDVVLGAVSGAGFTAVRLGGVQADARVVELTSFLGGGPTAPAPVATPTLSDPTTGVPSSSGSGSAAVTTTAPIPVTTTPSEPAAEERAIGPIMVPGSRGGPLVLIGLLGFLLAGIAAGRDRYLMRKAQQSVPMDMDVR